MSGSYDAVVVGSGPNGLAAAITLARAGRSVVVLEAKEAAGGGARTAELTIPGFHHDLCSAIHPFGAASPFFRGLPMRELGIEWVEPPVQLAHPFDDGSAALLQRSLAETAQSLDVDAAAYERLLGHFVQEGETLLAETLRPVRIPRHPLLMARFGLQALRSCRAIVEGKFAHREARALFAGCAAHSVVSLDRAGTASFGLMLLLAGHVAGWPIARGGSQRIADGMIEYLRSLGGEIQTSTPVRSLRELPPHRVALLDLTPRQVLAIVGDALPSRYRSRLARFRYGPGVFKIDWALDGPIPWKDHRCGDSGTVHVGGTWEEVARSEEEVWRGKVSERPFVLVAQQSRFDDSRAPAGRHTGWAYCHVPRGSTVDMGEKIEQQIERFAPGFRDLILARRTTDSKQFEEHNANLVGGDIGGGANTLLQLLARPTARFDPYSTPNERIYLCSSSTPPGGGVHGMCGYWGARSALSGPLG